MFSPEHSHSPTPAVCPLQVPLPSASVENRGPEKTESLEELGTYRDGLAAAFENSLKLCHQLLTAFDPLLGAHAEIVAEICAHMSGCEYFTADEKKVLVPAAWLHDIGLIGTEQSLLHKIRFGRKSMSAQEQAVYLKHPVRSQQLAAYIGNFKGLAETIRGHHELFNGQGFPDGLAGESIPWTARCLSVAVYFAECGLPQEQALKSILEQSGSAFDPDAVRLFFKMTQGASLPAQIREVMVDELSPGMKLAKGIYNAAGLLLVPEKQELTEATIAKIKNYNLLSLVRERLLVLI